MEQLPDYAYEYYYQGFNTWHDVYHLSKQTYIAHKLIALKEGEVFPVYITYGPQGGSSFLINNETIRINDRFYYGNSRGGYKIYHLDKFNLTKAIQKEKDYIKQCKRGLELGTKRLESLETFAKDYPEYAI